MLSPFNDSFKELAVRRIEDIYDSIINRDSEYILLSMKSKELYGRISRSLSEEDRHLIEEYERSELSLQEISEINICLQCLKDGMEMENLLGVGKIRRIRPVKYLMDRLKG